MNTHQGLWPRRRTAIATTIVQCRRCGLIFANPRPVPETLEDHYDQRPENYWHDAYFRADDGYYSTQVATFRRLWRGTTDPRALDVGAGIGKTMHALERHGIRAYGLEPSHSFRERALSSGIPSERLRLSSAEDAPLEPGSFDLVTLGAVLEHLHNPAAVLERALLWLTPGGLIHVEVPSARWLLARALNLFYRAQGLDYVTHLSPMHPPYHLYEFTLRSFTEHGARVGYQVVEHEHVVCNTFLPPPLSALAARVMKATATGMQLRLWLTRSPARNHPPTGTAPSIAWRPSRPSL